MVILHKNNKQKERIYKMKKIFMLIFIFLLIGCGDTIYNTDNPIVPTPDPDPIYPIGIKIDEFIFHSGISFQEYYSPILINGITYQIWFSGTIQYIFFNEDSTEYVVKSQDAFFRFYYEYNDGTSSYTNTSQQPFKMLGINPDIYPIWYPVYRNTHFYGYEFTPTESESIYLNSDRFGGFTDGNIKISIYEQQ